MTNEEAIQNLIQISRMYGHKWQQEACDMAIEALKKQIAVKPTISIMSVGYGHVKRNVCPTCSDVVKYPHPCMCGQKIDWEYGKEQ